MAEIFGLVVNITTVIGLAGKLANLGYGYIGGVMNASNHAERLVEELNSLIHVLRILQNIVKNDPELEFTALQRLNGQKGPLEGCVWRLKLLQLKLKPKDGWRDKMKVLTWLLKEKETYGHISRIERDKSLFKLALGLDHMLLSKEIANHLKEIEKDTKDMKDLVQVQTAALDSFISKMESDQLAKQRNQILQWLYPKDPSLKHIEISGQRQAGTGKWLFQKPKFKNWIKEQPDFFLLCGYGIGNSKFSY
ncbi:uncharacterized protein LAJ45_01721 [Morchella importuna]|uniref:uncharacterized protein n=1 Tax=Morchella importuna TaxID=1174673 RepID=UPI001E8EC738|nr:uncharacterized protein LAJ45_01721 [Morchella importuna]KAH8153954.1 hypothetical protein LAJ45_01721 [Morchella importuna]